MLNKNFGFWKLEKSKQRILSEERDRLKSKLVQWLWIGIQRKGDLNIILI